MVEVTLKNNSDRNDWLHPDEAQSQSADGLRWRLLRCEPLTVFGERALSALGEWGGKDVGSLGNRGEAVQRIHQRLPGSMAGQG